MSASGAQRKDPALELEEVALGAKVGPEREPLRLEVALEVRVGGDAPQARSRLGQTGDPRGERPGCDVRDVHAQRLAAGDGDAPVHRPRPNCGPASKAPPGTASLFTSTMSVRRFSNGNPRWES